MTATPEAPVRLAAILQEHVDKLGGAAFIGRHQSLVETNDDGSRWYYDPENPEVRYQSVTWTISSTESAPWLPAWAAGLAADVCLDNWALIGDMVAAVGVPATRTWIASEAKVQRELAADVGTYLHDVLEARLLSMPIPAPPEHVLGRTLKTSGEIMQITDEMLAVWAMGIDHFLADYRVRPVMAEATVCNPIEGYAARVDLMAEFPGYGLGLVDLKSGMVKQSATAQLTAQRHATEVWLPLGERIDMPPAQWGAVLHLRPKWQRGYKLQRVPTGPSEWSWFRALTRALKERERPASEVMYPPIFDADGEAAALVESPMVEDTGLRCAKALQGAGFTWLHELANVPVEQVVSDLKRGTGIKGVGPKAVDALRGLLAAQGLSFAGESLAEIAEVA